MNWKVVSLVLLVMMMMGGATGVVAQTDDVPSEVMVGLLDNSLVYSGPGVNAAYYEYVARGRNVIAAGRSSDSQWVQINIDGQIVGWVPVDVLTEVEGTIESLPVNGGLLDIGGGDYNVEDAYMRGAQVEMIKIQRPMRYIGARWFRLQGFLGANCEQIPAQPGEPVFTAAQLAAIPELAQLEQELRYVQQETAAAIEGFALLCEVSGGGTINQTLYLAGLSRLNNAYNAFDNLSRLFETLTGLEYIVR